MTHDHLTSACIDKRDVCRDGNCAHAVKVNRLTGRYFITMGHCGFNATANNGHGYRSEAIARKVLQGYLK